LALPVFEPRYVWPCILSWAQKKLASGQYNLRIPSRLLLVAAVTALITI